MRILGIVDYSYLYYKYKFTLASGRLKRLSSVVEIGGTKVEKDISEIYYTLREIEKIRKNLEYGGNEVRLAICFDSPAIARKEHASHMEIGEGQLDGAAELSGKYKANRSKKLSDEDFLNIGIVAELLFNAGYNVYKLEGYEADDLVTSLVENYKEIFDGTLIYTSDKDLLVNVCEKVALSKYKTNGDYKVFTRGNFVGTCEFDFKCRFPFNVTLLYLSTVGDKADNVPGIKGFGVKAFDKLIEHYESRGIDLSAGATSYGTRQLLLMATEYLGELKLHEALKSLELVEPLYISSDYVHIPERISTRDSRVAAYGPLGMKSLFD